jgi:hypothetical protein
MRVIQWTLLVGFLVSGCSPQETEDVSHQPETGFLTPRVDLSLPDLDDWPKNGGPFGPSLDLRATNDSVRELRANEGNVPFSRPF